jgi:hypothetical protein
MNKLSKMRLQCLQKRHLSKVLTALLSIAPFATHAQEKRLPSSYVPQDEIIVVPRDPDYWYANNNFMVDDDNGILNSMRVDFRRAQEQEMYYTNWGLQNTGMFNPSTPEERKSRFNRDILRYADKRLAGEVRKADKGSTLHRVGQAQKAMSPTTSVSFMSGYSIKFQARALQGKATINLVNPFVRSFIEMTLDGRQEFVTEKTFDFGFRTALNYRFDKGIYFTTFEQRLTPQWTASLVSTQPASAAAFSGAADKRIQLNYFYQF